MEVNIKATPKEIADLVLEIQSRQGEIAVTKLDPCLQESPKEESNEDQSCVRVTISLAGETMETITFIASPEFSIALDEFIDSQGIQGLII